jgi:hypothetical protein
MKSELPSVVLSECAFPGWFPAARWLLQNLGLFVQNDAFGLLDSMEHFMRMAKADICFALHHSS